MGRSDYFQKKRTGKSERKAGNRKPASPSFLIITEGTETEPNYFNGLKKYIETHYKSGFEVRPILKVEGEGLGTGQLVKEAVKISKNSHILYQNQWVVFDRDDFDDFDDAIQAADDNGFKVAWSNCCFEYWLFLHFNLSDAALSQSEWEKKLDDIFSKRTEPPKSYSKNDAELFKHAALDGNGTLKSAVKNAEKQFKSFDTNLPPSKKDPATTVYQLINELKPFIEELL